MLLMGGALVMERVISYCRSQEQGNAVLAVHYTVKADKPAVHY